jgi:hypothetical protein
MCCTLILVLQWLMLSVNNQNFPVEIFQQGF